MDRKLMLELEDGSSQHWQALWRMRCSLSIGMKRRIYTPVDDEAARAAM
jgi:hypothetical protein